MAINDAVNDLLAFSLILFGSIVVGTVCGVQNMVAPYYHNLCMWGAATAMTFVISWYYLWRINYVIATNRSEYKYMVYARARIRATTCTWILTLFAANLTMVSVTGVGGWLYRALQ